MTSFDPFADGSASVVEEANSFDPFSTGLAEESAPDAAKRAAVTNPLDMAGLFDGVDKMDGALDKASANALNLSVNGQTDKNTAKMRAANVAFLAAQFGKPVDEVAQNLPQYRKSYGNQVLNTFGELDDNHFYTRVGSHLRTEKKQQEMLAGFTGELYNAARQGKDFNETFAAWKEANQSTPGFSRLNDEYYRQYARQRYQFFRENGERLAEPIERVSAHMARVKNEGQLVSSEELIAENEEVLGMLSTLSTDDQELVLDFAAGAASKQTEGEEPPGAIKKGIIRAARGVDALADGVGSFFKERLFTSLKDVPASRAKEALSRKFMQRVSGEVDPLKTSSWLANGILDAAESMPRLLVSLNPVGLTANLMATKQDLRGRYEDQGLSMADADTLSSIAAAPYTALDFVSGRMVFKGKLPGLEKLLTAPVTGAAGLARRAALVGAGNTIEQLGQETAQDLTAPLVQSVASLLSEEIPEVNWTGEFQSLAKATPETFAGLLPLIAIGTGTATFKDRAYGRQYLQNSTALKALGFNDATTQKILEAPTPEEAGTVMVQNWDKREDGPAQREAVQTLNKESIAAREEMGETYGPQAKALFEKYPEELSSIPPGHIPVEIMDPDGKVYVAAVNGFYEFSPTNVQASVGRLTPAGWSHGLPRKGEVILTPLPTAEQWRDGVREVETPETIKARENTGLVFEYLGKQEQAVQGVGEPVDQWQVINPTEGGRGRTMTAEQMKAEGITPPPVPGKRISISVTRGQDGEYIVSDPATSTVLGTAPTQEGAAQIVQDRQTDLAAREQRERDAAPPAPPKNTPETEGSPVPERTSALNKNEITALRQIYGMDALPAPQRQRWEQVLSQAKEKGLQATADALAESILENPRLINAEEHASMNLRAAELQNQYERLVTEAGVEFAAGNIKRAEELRQAYESTHKALDTITEASDRTGTEIGRALSIRRMRISRETYRLADIVSRAQVAKQSQVTPEETEKFRKLSEQIAIQEAKIADLEAKLAPALAAAAEANAKTFVEEARSRRSSARRENAGQRRLELKKELAKLGYRLNDITGSVGLSVEAATIIAKIADTYIDEGVSSLSDLVASLQKTIPDLSTQDIYNAVGRRIQKQAKKIETEVKRRQRDLRNQAALAGKIKDALEGKFDKAKIKPSSPEATDLRMLLRELRLQADQTSRDDASLKAIHEKINQIQDQISGGYRLIPEGQPDRNPDVIAAEEALAEARREMAEIDRALLAKTEPEINAERRKKLEAQIADIEKQLKEGFRPVRQKKVADEVSTATIRKQFEELQRLLRTEDAIADLEEQLRTGDYKVSAPEQRVLQNAELEKALVKRQQLQREVNDQIENMRKKTVGEILVEPFNISRALVLTADMSGALRQGIVLSARRPITATKAFAQAFTAFFSQNRADAIDLAIRRNPNQIERDKAGLYLSAMGGSLNRKEESFASNLAQRIPLLGAIVRGSERNMTTMLNLIRSSAFDQFLTTYPEATIEQKQAFARYINVASGRGDLGKFSAAAKPLSVIFLAPRFAISRFQTPLALAKNWNEPTVRKEIAKDFLAFASLGMTVLGLAALAGAQVGDDPESPDFGKIVWGNTRIDIWGGLQQPVRLALLPILAGLDRAGIRETQKDIDLIDAGRRFLSYKLSPAVNLPATLITGKNIIGQEQSTQETLLRSITPLIAQETAEIYQQTEDASKAALAAGLQFIGVGVNEQTPKAERK